MATCTSPPPPSNLSNLKGPLHLAHTAQCKLHIAANRPDRDLRYILGHAFTLDKLRLRIAEIESDSSSEEENEQEKMEGEDRTVKFKSAGVMGGAKKGERKRSPPPSIMEPVDDDDEQEAEAVEEGDENEKLDEDSDEEADGMALKRFGSAAASPPRKLEDEKKPMQEPREEELKSILQEDGNERLKDGFNGIARCRCHGKQAPIAEKVWELPYLGDFGKEGGRRMAVVQVAA